MRGVRSAVKHRPKAVLFELALGLSAWKEYGGSRWALRCNPSSGNLHPTEAYVVAGAAIHRMMPRILRKGFSCTFWNIRL